MRGGDCMGGAAVRAGLSCTKCNSHPSTASIPITVLPYGPLLCGFNMPIKYLLTSIHTNRRTIGLQQSWRSSYMRRSKVMKVCIITVGAWLGDSSSGFAVCWWRDPPHRLERVLQLLYWSFQVEVQTDPALSWVQSYLRRWYGDWSARTSHTQGCCYH